MVAHFLKLQESQPEYYTDDIIKGLILVSSSHLSLSVFFSILRFDASIFEFVLF